MLIRYEYVTYRGETAVKQADFLDFACMQSNGDQLDDAQVKIAASCEMLAALVEALLKKGVLSMQDLETILPHKNYVRLISLDADWDNLAQR